MRFSPRAVRWCCLGFVWLAAILTRAAEESAAGAALDPHPVATTRAGRVRGYVDHGIVVFKGIPYGADTARRRFRAPVPPAPWSDILDTVEFRAASPQDASAKPNPDWGVETEDCLHLNVWTPALRDGRKRPVFVYFHGGGYGTSSGNNIDGRFLSQRGDAVVVAVNHRLNGFGYLYLREIGAPEFADAANAGDLDLVLSLTWVRDNIREFGGDPGCVTIFGGSGGAMKCEGLMTMPAAHGLFHRVWTTGEALVRGLSSDQARAETEKVLHALGLTPERIGEINTVPMARLIHAFDGHLLGPVVDGTHLPRAPFHPDASPLSAGIPLVLGTTRDEMTPFLDRDPKFDNLTWERMLELLRAYQLKTPSPEEVVAEYRKLYPDMTPREVFFAAATDGGVWRRIVTVAERRVPEPGATYVYCLDWPGRGLAAHCIDLPLMMNRPDGGWRINGRPGVEAVSALLTDALIAFARTGSPQTPALPEWPRYNLEARPTMVFDVPPRIVPDHRGAERRLFARLPPP